MKAILHLIVLSICIGAASLSMKRLINIGISKDPYPILKSPPLISLIKNGTFSMFKCDIQYQTGNGGMFEVTWMMDDARIGYEHLTPSERTAYLSLNNIRGHVGKSLYCTCKSYFITTPTVKSGIFTSKGFYCGIQITPPILYSKNSIAKYFAILKSTFPIPCKNGLQLQPEVTDHDVQFLYLGNVLSWKEARTACRGQGYDIASIDTTDKWIRARQYLQKVSLSHNPVWIGLFYNRTNEHFNWVNGRNAVDSTPWDTNEPDTLLQDHCVNIQQSNFSYRNVDCLSQLPVLCSKSADPVKSCQRNIMHSLGAGSQLMSVTLGQLKSNTTKLVWFSQSEDCPFLNGLKFGPLQIYPQSVSIQESCTIDTNTGATTFDNLQYQAQATTGEYILMIDGKNYEKIEGRFWTCSSRPCLCGIVIQYVDDAVKLDRCQSLLGGNVNDRITVSRTGSKTAGIDVGGDDVNGYTVSLPTGLKVKVMKSTHNSADHSIDIKISVTSAHKGLTSGFCGTYDGIRMNELLGGDNHIYTATAADEYKFMDTWKIPSRQSLFDQEPKYYLKEKPSFEQCECDSRTGAILC